MYVCVLEDDVARLAAFRAVLPALLPAHAVVTFDHAARMVRWLADHLVDTALIALDHDLPLTRSADGTLVDHGTGRDVADHLATQPAVCPVVVHTSNADAAVGMLRVLDEAGWPTARVHPDADAAFVAGAWAATVRQLRATGLIAG